MITTLPGLYLVSVGVVKPATWIFGWSEHIVCSIGMLRFVNLLFSVGNFYLLYLLFRKVQPRHKVCWKIRYESLCSGANTWRTGQNPSLQCLHEAGLSPGCTSSNPAPC